MNEPLLAIEGALGSFSVALLARERVVARRLDGRHALERGLGILDGVLEEGKQRLADLGGIAVGTGPGGFTGLRIAIAFAKSLALGGELPLAGVSSFDILDVAANAETIVPRLTVVSGRTGIACIRRTDADGNRVACGPVESAVARLVTRGEPIALVGATEDVQSAVRERGISVHLVPAPVELPAATLARIARSRAPAASVHAVAPDYGETPAAKTPT
ncbi:MAG: tRNA (adenosine(37)-N6)-threonylcarbamoyltransferase complex dimerization subunit type 1 TsaB [Vulcanimicrobiaceae bacterium]